MQYISEVFDNVTSKYLSINGTPLTNNTLANPCGKIARAFFTDTYKLYNNSATKDRQIYINETNIANPYDVQYMYKQASNANQTQWIDVTNEHFIVWMSMETLVDFKKKWGRIDGNILPGNYTLNISNSKCTDFKVSIPQLCSILAEVLSVSKS